MSEFGNELNVFSQDGTICQLVLEIIVYRQFAIHFLRNGKYCINKLRRAMYKMKENIKATALACALRKNVMTHKYIKIQYGKIYYAAKIVKEI